MKKVLLLLADGFETFEASAFIDVIGWNLELGDCNTQLYSCGIKKEVKTSFNQKFIVDYFVDEIDVNSFHALAVPGGFGRYEFYKGAYDDKFLDIVKRFRKDNKIIASICTGALALGKSGVLNKKNGTIYNNENRRKELQGYGVNIVNQPIVMDDNIITSWNPSTSIDVALLLLEYLTTKENSKKIRKLMGFEN